MGGGIGDDRLLQAAPASDPVQTDQGQGEQRGDDDEELQNLVVDRRGQAAEGDVGEDDDGGDDERHPQGPAQQALHDRAQQVEVDAGDEQLRQGEGQGVDQMGRGPVAAEHELRNRADLGAVVEGHHDQAEEDHRRDRADPEVVEGRQAVLGPVGGHAHDLHGAQVGRDEGDAGDPGGQRAPGGEELVGGGRLAPGHESHADDEGEVDDDREVVVPASIDERGAGGARAEDGD